MAQRKPCPIEPADFERLTRALAQWATGSVNGARLRAIVALAHASALGLHEVLGLRLTQAIDFGASRRWTVTTPFHVMIHGAVAVVPEQAGPALQCWITEAVKIAKAAQNPIPWPPKTWPLFFTLDAKGHPATLNQRTAQEHFAQAQRRAQLAHRYRFQDLRHDALIAFAARTGSAAKTASFGRLRDERSAVRFLPSRAPTALAELAQLARRS